MGIQLLPGAPSDPSQPEAPSIPELLGTLAANIYGGDSRYSAAAGIGSGLSDIFGGIRTKRNEVQALQALKGLYPDLPLDKLGAAGIKPTFGDIATLQKQKQQEQLLETLSKTLASPDAGKGVQQVSLPQWLAAKEAGISLPQKLLPGMGGGFPKTNEILAGGIGLLDPATGQPRGPQTPEEFRKLAQELQHYQAGTAGAKTASEEQAKSDVGGVSKFIGKPVPNRLLEFGVDPTKVAPGDPMLAQAEESLAIEKGREKITTQEKLIKRAVNEAGPLMDRMRSYIEQMKKAGIPTDQTTIADQWRKFHLMTSPGMLEKSAGAVLGEPLPAYQKLFSLSGQVRSRLAAPYMGSGMPRSIKGLQDLQRHMPQENESDVALIESLNVIRPMVDQLKKDFAPTRDPIRLEAIRKLTGKLDPDTGRKITAKYAEYLIDKRMGVTPDSPAPNQPTVQQEDIQ